MAEYLAGGNEVQPGTSAKPGWILLPSAQNRGRGWNFIPLAPGICGGFLAYGLYPLLAGRTLLLIVFFAFFVVAAVVPRAVLLCGLGLGLLAVVLLLNGALDRLPPEEIKTTIIDKSMVDGSVSRHAHYDLIVSSWRPGRSQEDFEVDLGTYRRAAIGESAIVELHHGYFGLPWYSNISPE